MPTSSAALQDRRCLVADGLFMYVKRTRWNRLKSILRTQIYRSSLLPKVNERNKITEAPLAGIPPGQAVNCLAVLGYQIWMDKKLVRAKVTMLKETQINCLWDIGVVGYISPSSYAALRARTHTHTT